MPCPAHRYDTLLSACLYIGAIEPSARAPDTNLSLPYTPSRSASLPLRSSHTLAYIFTVRGCAACASTTIHIAHRHHVALSGRQLPSHSVVAPLTRTSAGVMRTVMAWWHASPIHVARHTLVCTCTGTWYSGDGPAGLRPYSSMEKVLGRRLVLPTHFHSHF